MSTKKNTPTKRRRRKKGLSSAPTRRRRSSSKKGLLSDMFNPTIAMQSAKNTISAGVGGVGAMIVNKAILPSTAGKGMKTLVALGVGFLASSFGMANVGSGFTGGMMALTFQNGLMNEDADFANPNVLSDQPMFLDEDGNPMVLEENDGEPYYRYLTEDEVQMYAQQ